MTKIISIEKYEKDSKERALFRVAIDTANRITNMQDSFSFDFDKEFKDWRKRTGRD